MSISNTSFNVKNGLVVNTNLLFANNGRVGVGTITPDTLFTVAGTANVQGNVAVTGTLSTTANVVTVNVYATTTTSNVVSLTLTSNSINANVIAANSITTAANTIFNANVYIAANSYLYVSGNLVVNGTLTTVNAVSANGNSIPATNSTFTLGNSTYTWSSLYVSSNVNVGSISTTANGFVANTTTITVGNSTVNAVINSTSQSLGYIGSLPGFTANTTVITVGNSSVNATVNSTAFSGSATSLVGYTFDSPATIGSTTANTGNFSTLSIAGSAVATYANLVSYIATTVPTLTSNAANYLGTTAAASYVQNTDSRTLSGNVTFSGAVTSFTGANVTFSSTSKIIANSAFGTVGQVLASNGTGVYWSSAIGYTGSAGSASTVVGPIGYTGSQGVIGYTGSSATITSSTITTALGSVRVANAVYSDSAGYATSAGSATTATSATNATNAANATYATSAGSATNATNAINANTVWNGSSNMTFHWSGQGGQPTWLWGGNSPGDMYVYNPSNFSVGYASHAGYSDYANGLNGGLSYSAVDFTATSDDRLKDISGPITNALDKVDTLTGFYYKNNETAKSLGLIGENQQVGVSAQTLKEVLPEAVSQWSLENDYMVVAYDRIIPLLIEAIKELRAEVKTLKG